MVLEGVVVEGRRLGRELGFPTANVEVCDNSDNVRRGVYRSIVTVEGVVDGVYNAVTNVGVNPTVSDGVALRSESYLFDFEGNIYGRRVRIELKERLREEVRFDTLDALKAQIAKDVELAKSLIRR